jgi:hypothetical protein
VIEALLEELQPSPVLLDNLRPGLRARPEKG